MKEKLKKLRKSRIFSLVQILFFIAVCIAVGAGIAYVEHESDPTEQAVKYFRAFVQKDYEKMYEYIDREEGYYLSKDMYMSAVKSMREAMVIDSYNIKEPQKEDGKQLVVIECTNADTEKKQNFNVYLNEKRKGMQIVPDYYINIDELITKNFSVVMKKENQLELNGEKITKDMAYISTDKEGNATYVFDGIISGNYRVCAVNDYVALVKNVDLTEKDTKVKLLGDNYTANDSYTKLLNDNGSKMMDLFYTAVRKREPSYKKLKSHIGKNNKVIKKVQEFVAESQGIVYWQETRNIDNYTVKNFKVKDLKKSIKYVANKKQFIVKYTYNYDYESKTDTALYTSYVYSISGNCKSTMTLTYKIKDNSILLSDMELVNENNKDV